MWMNWCEHVAFVGHFTIQCKIVRLLLICMQIFTLTLRFKCITHTKRWTIPIIEKRKTTNKLEKSWCYSTHFQIDKLITTRCYYFIPLKSALQWQFQFTEMVGEKKTNSINNRHTDSLALRNSILKWCDKTSKCISSF